MLYWLSKRLFIGPWLRLLFRPQVEGAEHIPAAGPAILASNHLSFSDSIFVPLIMKRRITYLAKSDYFTGPGVKGALTKWFFIGTGQVPIDRASGTAAAAALRAGCQVLEQGELLGIYPEGTRSPDGRLYRGKTGVARLALATGAPVIPVAMMNTHEIQPIGARMPHIMRVQIRMGTPMDFARYDGLAGDRVVERAITDEIMTAIADLSGQEYVDVYAAGVKAGTIQARPARLATVDADDWTIL